MKGEFQRDRLGVAANVDFADRLRPDRGDRGPREWIDRGAPQQGGPRQPATLEGLMEKFGGQTEKKQNNVKLAISLKSLMRSGR